MFRFLRRFQPSNPALAVLYWLGLTLVTLVVLFFVFLFVDGLLPGGGMF